MTLELIIALVVVVIMVSCFVIMKQGSDRNETLRDILAELQRFNEGIPVGTPVATPLLTPVPPPVARDEKGSE